jgi:hypothetical protein
MANSDMFLWCSFHLNFRCLSMHDCRHNHAFHEHNALRYNQPKKVGQSVKSYTWEGSDLDIRRQTD